MIIKEGTDVSFGIGNDTLVIGRVIRHEEGSDDAVVYECHAFHKLWGGSSGGRGGRHTVSVKVLEACPPTYRHIIKQVMEKEADGS